MPATEFRNLLYKAALPFAAPDVRNAISMQNAHISSSGSASYKKILEHHHVLGASLLLKHGDQIGTVYASLTKPVRNISENSVFRVASITKMATALVILSLVQDGAFTLDTPVSTLLPDGNRSSVLSHITPRMLLSHTSGLQDCPAYMQVLSKQGTIYDVLSSPACITNHAKHHMIYCNFGYGLLGCIAENVTGQPLEQIYGDRVFKPLKMRATMEAISLLSEDIVPINRVFPYHANAEVTITKLGTQPITNSDPLRHFGHSAGAMYTDPFSLSLLLDCISGDNTTLLKHELIVEMKKPHAFMKRGKYIRKYGLGLEIIEDRSLSDHTIYGHQGFAYGCVDGAFWEEDTHKHIIQLNGGASEARKGILGVLNTDVLQWALKQEMTAWH